MEMTTGSQGAITESEIESQTATTEDEVEVITEAIDVADIPVDANLEMDDEEAFAYKILRRAAMLNGVAIKRDVFLRTELAKKCTPEQVDAAVETTPQKAGIPMDVIDELADAAISIETRKVSGLSALAGIPGGLVLFGTIPADLMQYFAHSLRIEQKLAYLYGWESFLSDEDEIDDETMYQLILFLGVMMQVGGVNVSLTKFAAKTAQAGVAKAIEKQALTKTVWYKPLQHVLKVIGVKMTKSTLAETMAKGVPLLGGAVSGGITYFTFHPGAVSLKKYLRTLPQATGIILPEEEMEEVIKQIEEESKADFSKAFDSAKQSAGEAVAVVADKASIFATAAMDTAGVVADATASGVKRGFESVSGTAGTVADATASGVKRGFESVLGKWGKIRQKKAKGSLADVSDELRALKDLLDDGVITQEDFDEKKRVLLGLSES